MKSTPVGTLDGRPAPTVNRGGRGRAARTAGIAERMGPDDGEAGQDAAGTAGIRTGPPIRIPGVSASDAGRLRADTGTGGVSFA